MLNDFYKNWIQLELDDPEPKMKPYEKCWLAGAVIAVIGGCGIDSETWIPFAALIGIGAGVIAMGLWRWKQGGMDHERSL